MRPYALLRAGFPYLKTIGEQRKLIVPCDLAVHNDGRIFAYCWGSNYGKGFSGPISIINFDDDDLGSFGWRAYQGYSVTHSAFKTPEQVVLDKSQQRLIFSDSSCHRISVFTTDGEYIGRWGEHGSGDGQLDRPAGLAIDSEDNLWIVDANNHRIQRFTRDGRFLGKFGGYGTGDGQLNTPWGIHIDEAGRIYIGDWRNDRIQVFDSEGKYLWKFGSSGTGNGEFRRPAGVAVDKDGDIYVADWGNNRVQLFTPEGRYVQQFHGDATLSKTALAGMYRGNNRKRRMRVDADLEQEKRFTRPRSVRVDTQGHMYVPDYEHYRVQIYKKEAYPLDETQILPPFKVPTLNAN